MEPLSSVVFFFWVLLIHFNMELWLLCNNKRAIVVVRPERVARVHVLQIRSHSLSFSNAYKFDAYFNILIFTMPWNNNKRPENRYKLHPVAVKCLLFALSSAYLFGNLTLCVRSTLFHWIIFIWRGLRSLYSKTWYFLSFQLRSRERVGRATWCHYLHIIYAILM